MLGKDIFFAVFQGEDFKMVDVGVVAAVGGKQKIDAGDVLKTGGWEEACTDFSFRETLLQGRLRSDGICGM